jgi:hypothetical protein
MVIALAFIAVVTGMIGAIGYLLIRSGTSEPKVVPAATIEAICGCQHHRCFHENGTERCHYEEDGRPTEYSDRGVPIDWELIECRCQLYLGPVSIDEIYTSEISS